MNSRLDNTELVREKLLKYDHKGDFYFAMVLKRRKDTKGKMLEGVNEDNRLIKHYFFYDLDYFDKKIESVKRLCDDNDARAYLLPQRRNDLTILCALHEKTGELIDERAKNAIKLLFEAVSQKNNLLQIAQSILEEGELSCADRDYLKNMLSIRRKEMDGEIFGQGIHFDHLIRSCVAGCHLSDRKRWVIDLDHDSEELKNLSDSEFDSYVLKVIDKITEIRSRFGQNVNCDTVIVPTPHGKHIVTEPFNKSAINAQKMSGNSLPYWKPDWLKEDAMTLIYSSLKNDEMDDDELSAYGRIDKELADLHRTYGDELWDEGCVYGDISAREVYEMLMRIKGKKTK